MMLRRAMFFVFLVLLSTPLSVARAHTPLVLCMDNGDNTITCQGGFSDGSSAAGVAMRIKVADGRVLLEGRMDGNSEFTFDKPRGDFSVVFDAGAEHRLQVPGRQITQ